MRRILRQRATGNASAQILYLRELRLKQRAQSLRSKKRNAKPIEREHVMLKVKILRAELRAERKKVA